MRKTPQSPRLRDLPLWRLLVALADAERAFGPTDKTTRTFAQIVQERLAKSESDLPDDEERLILLKNKASLARRKGGRK
jgi:hypothetical protein